MGGWGGSTKALTFLVAPLVTFSIKLTFYQHVKKGRFWACQFFSSQILSSGSLIAIPAALLMVVKRQKPKKKKKFFLLDFFVRYGTGLNALKQKNVKRSVGSEARLSILTSFFVPTR